MEKYVIVIEENEDPKDYIMGDPIPRSDFYFVSTDRSADVHLGWSETKTPEQAIKFDSIDEALEFMSKTSYASLGCLRFMSECEDHSIFPMKESEAVAVVVMLGELRDMN